MAKFNVVFRDEKCKGCGLCASVCPKSILEIDSENVNLKGYHPIHMVDIEECIGCCSCALMCPDGIINIYRI